MGESVTKCLAEHIAAVRYDELPPDVVEKTRLCLLDSLGCMIGGSEVDEIRRATEIVLEWGQGSGSYVPGIDDRYPESIAAYAAAQFANALDYDDTVLGVGHPGAAVIATALALGQEREASGKDLVAAIVVGYDAAIRVGRGMKPSEQRAKSARGHTWAIFGSVAAAASLLDLTAEQCRFALGFAAQHALVPFVGKWYERPITMIKNNYGWAAMGGIGAAQLAARGAEGTPDVLDGDSGFWTMASSDQWNPDIVTVDLGTRYSVLDVEFKPFAACRYTHTALDALTEVLSECTVEPSSVDRIVVRAAERARIFADYEPKTLLDAQFSLPSAIARTVLGRSLTSFDPHDSEVTALASKVEIVTDEDAERRASFSGLPATVEVHLRDGQKHVAHSDVAPGTPERAMSQDQLTEKFMTLSAPVIGLDQAESLCQMILGDMESVSANALAEKYRRL